MTIAINNVDQEICGHFLWDLAHKAIRGKFKFDLDTASNAALHGGVGQAVITVERVRSPPHHHQLEFDDEEDNRGLTPNEQSEIGLNLYKIFSDDKVFARHKERFESTYWTVGEMEAVREWLTGLGCRAEGGQELAEKGASGRQPGQGHVGRVRQDTCQGVFSRRGQGGVISAYDWIEEGLGIKEVQATIREPPTWR